MATFAITGVGGPLGQRVLARLADDDAVETVVGIDRAGSRLFPKKLRYRDADLLTDDLKVLFEGVDAVAHLAWDDRGRRDDGPAVRANVDRLRRVLDAAAAASVRTVVHVSSATAYGAWPDNPVPLPETAGLRPNPGFAFAAEHAECERLLLEWQDDHPGTRAVILRSVPVLSAGDDGPAGWLARALGVPASLRVRSASPPIQVVHPDDVAAAVHLALADRGADSLDGTYNVAPDGFIAGESLVELAGGPPVVRVPEAIADRVGAAAWRVGLSDQPPSVRPYVTHPWVVANDRLRAAGWEPQHTNEEVLVAATPGSRWREMSPKRRQEIALAVTGVGLAGVVAVVVALVRRSRRAR